MTDYKFWCAYCGKELTLTQQTPPTPEQQVCDYCKSILDTYKGKEL